MKARQGVLFWLVMDVVTALDTVQNSVLTLFSMWKTRKWSILMLLLYLRWKIQIRWRKKGFVTTLGNIEANGIKVDIISTDRHPLIKKDIRVNHADVDHQFDPWHLAKSVSKKLSAASKKAGCSDLAPWIPSIINHL